MAGVACFVLGGVACNNSNNNNQKPTDATLTITTDGEGTTDPAPGPHGYLEGTSLTVTATAADRNAFMGWSGDGTGTSNPMTIVLDVDKTVVAGFSSKTHGLPIPSGGGVPRPSGTPGNLAVIDWAGFKGAVTYTLDDSQPSQIEHYAELQATGVPMTFYLSSGWSNTSAAYDTTWAQAVRDGHEIGNHTVHHCRADITGCSLPPPPLATPADEIELNRQYIMEHAGQSDVWTMASPFGDANWDSIAKQRVFLHRDVFGGMVRPNDGTDPFHLPVYMAGTADGGFGTGQSQFDALIDTARANDTWLIFLIHTILPTTNNWYNPIDIGVITGSITRAKALNDVWIDTMVSVGAYWRAQKLLTATAPSTTGNVMTWTWTLPDHFPPGKYVRVKVDGGTLAQGGAPLVWDGRGYYEVSLDASSLTLSP